MHRHSNIGKKLSRTAGPRKALLRGLVDSLILYERVETTQARAKEVSRIFDKMVTKAKKQDLHNYRQVKSFTINPIAAEKLFTDLVNGFKTRNSGFTRLIKTGKRLGDGSDMVLVELILDVDYKKSEPNQSKTSGKKESKPAEKPKPAKTDSKDKTKKEVAK